nr:alpha/beta hydrolase [Phycicoccus sp. HDW14]
MTTTSAPVAPASTSPEIGRTVTAGGIGTNVHVLGDPATQPVVLLVHGSGPGVTAYANWRLTMPALAERFCVVAPDMVGFGFTERPDGFEYSMPHWTAHLVALMDELGVEQADVVGNSFGGGWPPPWPSTTPSACAGSCSWAPRSRRSASAPASTRSGATARPWRTCRPSSSSSPTTATRWAPTSRWSATAPASVPGCRRRSRRCSRPRASATSTP